MDIGQTILRKLGQVSTMLILTATIVGCKTVGSKDNDGEIVSSAKSSISGVVGYINYANNPGTLTLTIPEQFASSVYLDNSNCPGVSLDDVDVYSTSHLEPTRRLDNNSFLVNDGDGAYIFALAISTSGVGICQLPLYLSEFRP